MSRAVEIRGLGIDFPVEDGPDGRARRSGGGERPDPPAVRPVVRGLDLEVERGEAVALVGRSGSGKSLTALALLGLVPDRGRVTANVLEVAGHDLLALDTAGWRRFRGRRAAMVFQDADSALNPTIPVGRQLMEPLEVHRRTGPAPGAGREGFHQRVLSLLDEVELGEDPAILTRYPHQFSGGQRQRLVLAMALACEPDLLIADEPTTALDVTTQARIVELVERIRRRHRTAVLWITHDLAVAAQVAERIAVLHDGRIVDGGPPGRILEVPAHPATRELVEAARWETGGVSGAPDPVSDRARGAGREGAGSAGATAPAPPASEPLLSVRDLRFRYLPAGRARARRRVGGLRLPGGTARGGPPALEGVSLHVRAGEMLAVVGESGSGKSTLARVVTGLLRPEAGEVRFRQAPLAPLGSGRDPTSTRQIQMIFQDPFGSLNPRQRVGEAVREPLDIHGLEPVGSRATRVARLLEHVGLEPGLALRLPHQLSGGERQRVAIARALATDPLLLVADEPVTALDAPVQRQVLELLERLRRERGLACLLIAHDLGTVARVADRVAVLAGGRVVEEGPAEAVLGAPAHPSTRALVDAIPHLPG